MGIIETIKMLEREEGIEAGMLQKNREFVRNLLQQTDFDAPRIAELVGVSVDFVLDIQKELKAQ